MLNIVWYEIWKCLLLLIVTEKKTFFLFLCKIITFQNQNTYYQNFNLIISDSRLFNSISMHMRVGTYLDQIQAIM